MRLGLGLGLGRGFAPPLGRLDLTAFSGLTGWYWGDDVILTSGKVSQWNDHSGGAHHYTQGVGAARPIVGTISGRAGVEFDGTDDALLGPAVATMITAASSTIFAVFYAHAIDTNNGSWTDDVLWGDAGNDYTSIMFRSAPTIRYYVYSGGANFAPSEAGAAITLDTPTLVRARHHGGSIYLAINGGAESSAAAGAVDSMGATSSFGRGGGATYFNGTLGDVAIFNTGDPAVLTPATITAIESNLMALYGI